MTSPLSREETARRRQLLFKLLARHDFDRPRAHPDKTPEPPPLIAALEDADTLIFS